mgnify:CR=1 FL=1
MVQHKINAYLTGEIIKSNTEEARNLKEKSSFGEFLGKNKDNVQYSFSEVLYLVENGKMDVYSLTGKEPLGFDKLFRKFRRADKKIQIKYPVFKDLRDKGFIVKTALKFGADFRVYDKGTRPGKSHAKWLVFAEHESSTNNWKDFSAKNRVAHSTRKKLLIAILDQEGDVLYYEVSWVKI